MENRHYAVPLAMAQRNLKLLETGGYHDFVIKCGGREFKVHRNIVCPQSVMLGSLCKPTWKEDSEGCADLKEEDPEVVEKALRLLYTGSYDRVCPCGIPSGKQDQERWRIIQDDPSHELLFHIPLYIFADYLDVEAFKESALQNCKHHLIAHFDAWRLLDSITLAFANTKSDDSGLRPQILRSCVANLSDIQACPALWTLLQDQEPLAWSLLLEARREQKLLQSQLRESRAEASLNQSLLQNYKKDLERAHENMKAAVKLADRTKQCRNEACDKEFGATLETYANGYIKGLRCKRCKCRHSVTQP